MRLMNAALSAGLLFTLVSCGDNSSSSSKRGPSVDTLVTSADWKILLEGRSFPAKSMISVNDEIVVNECADKQSYFINRETTPETLAMPGYKVPQAVTVKIAVEDCTSGSVALEPAEYEYEMTKNGAHAEVIVRL